MLKIYLYSLLFIYSLTHAFSSEAQVRPMPDSGFYNSLYSNATQQYSDVLGENLGLYNGSEYVGSYSRTVGHPFFESDKIQQGNIFYDGVFYKNVPLSYDLLRNEVITLGHSQNFNIKLVTEKIDYFSILDHVFVRLDPDSSNSKLITSGFYDMLLQGKISVFVKRLKTIQAGLKTEDNLKFAQYDRYFIKKDNNFYQVDSEKSLLTVFDDQKNTVKKYLRKNNLKYRRDPANTILKAVEYFSQLKS